MQRELEHPEAEDRALEPDRRERDAELVEKLVLRHGSHVAGGAALHEVAQHRRRRLADRAASAVEADLLDHVSLAEAHRDGDFVPAQRVLPFRLSIGMLEQPVVPRVLVVVQDELAIELVELAHR